MKAEKVKANVETGKSYYMVITVQRNFLSNHLFAQLIPGELAEMMLPSLKQQDNFYDSSDMVMR